MRPRSRVVITKTLSFHCLSSAIIWLISTTISLVQPWQGNLDVNEAHCFKLWLRDGDFVRSVVELVATDLEVLAEFSIELYAAGRYLFCDPFGNDPGQAAWDKG